MKFRNLFIFIGLFLLMLVSVNAQIYPTSYNVTSGTETAGNLTCLSSIDTPCIYITEISGSPGYAIEFEFTNVSDFTQGNLKFSHTGGAGSHLVDYELYDFIYDAWFDIDQALLPDSSVAVTWSGSILDTSRFIENNTVRGRFIHEDTGNPSHEIIIYSAWLDYEETETINCPLNETQNRNSYLLLTIICLLILFAIATKTYIIGFFASFGLLMYSLTISDCNLGVFYTLFGSSILIMVYFIFGSTD